MLETIAEVPAVDCRRTRYFAVWRESYLILYAADSVSQCRRSKWLLNVMPEDFRQFARGSLYARRRRAPSGEFRDALSVKARRSKLGFSQVLRMRRGDWKTLTLLPDGTVLMRLKNKSAMSVAGRLFKKGRRARSVDDLSR